VTAGSLDEQHGKTDKPAHAGTFGGGYWRGNRQWSDRGDAFGETAERTSTRDAAEKAVGFAEDSAAKLNTRYSAATF
jgi:hypothetical protein